MRILVLTTRTNKYINNIGFVFVSLRLELMLLQESDKFQHMSSVLLMSLLENSVHDFSLCHDGICMANQVALKFTVKRIMHHGFMEE